MKIQHSSNIARIAFFKRCWNHNIIPNCVKLKYNKKKHNNILKRDEVSILRSELGETRHELFKLNEEIENIRKYFMETLDLTDCLSQPKAIRV